MIVSDGLKARKIIRIIGDNVDWFVKVHEEVLGHTAHMRHAFASVVVVDGIINSEILALPSVKPQRDYRTLDSVLFLPSHTDKMFLEKKFVTLISDILIKYILYCMQFRYLIDENSNANLTS
jgi:hypothetical protein